MYSKSDECKVYESYCDSIPKMMCGDNLEYETAVSDYARLTGTLFQIIDKHYYSMSMSCGEYYHQCFTIVMAVQGLHDEVEKRYMNAEEEDEKKSAKELKHAISNILYELNCQRDQYSKLKMEEIAKSMFILISTINFKFITIN